MLSILVEFGHPLKWRAPKIEYPCKHADNLEIWWSCSVCIKNPHEWCLFSLEVVISWVFTNEQVLPGRTIQLGHLLPSPYAKLSLASSPPSSSSSSSPSPSSSSSLVYQSMTVTPSLWRSSLMRREVWGANLQTSPRPPWVKIERDKAGILYNKKSNLWLISL